MKKFFRFYLLIIFILISAGLYFIFSQEDEKTAVPDSHSALPAERKNFDLQKGVHDTPLETITYLRQKPNKAISDKAQLLILWQIYEPQQVDTPEYRLLAREIHEGLLNYLSNKKNWQASWRDQEYKDGIGDDYQACYADFDCLLNILPYWFPSEKGYWNELYIPCAIGQKHNKVIYRDAAAGGHGAETYLISDCELDDKYKFPQDVEEYFEQLSEQKIPNSAGSSRFAMQALWREKYLQNIYTPDFTAPPGYSTDNLIAEWAVDSYYTWKTYQNVLNFGIGYHQALKKLTEHYQNTFNVTESMAQNAAMQTLEPPAMEFGAIESLNDIRYLLLSGADWNKIQPQLSGENCQSLFSLAIAYPETLSRLIAECRKLTPADKPFSVDNQNYFKKTALMYAAQYGFIDSVKILLQNGANINHQTAESNCYSEHDYFCIHNARRTALMYAAQEGHFEIIKYLISQNADINIRDSQGKTALDYAAGTATKYNPQLASKIYDGSVVSREKGVKYLFTRQQIIELEKLLATSQK